MRTGALATRVLFDEPADGVPVATGVEYLAQPHAYRADPQADRRTGAASRARCARAAR